MAKRWNNVKRVRYSKKNRRFFTSFDMAEAKRTNAILNSQIKRGEVESKSNRYMCDCGCECSGCIIVGEFNN